MRSDRVKHSVLILALTAAAALLATYAFAQTGGDCPSGPTRVTLAPQEPPTPSSPLRFTAADFSPREALSAALTEWHSPVFGHISFRALPRAFRQPRGLTR